MTLTDNPQHRERWLQNVRHIQAEIVDLMTQVSIAVNFASTPTTELLSAADVHCELAIKELDAAAQHIGRIP